MPIVAQYDMIHNGVDLCVRITTDCGRSSDLRRISMLWDEIPRNMIEELTHEIITAGASWSSDGLQNSIINQRIVEQSASTYMLQHSCTVFNSDLPNAIFISIEISRYE